MARKKIREYDSKRLLREHLKRLAGIDLQILSAQFLNLRVFAWLLHMGRLNTKDLMLRKHWSFEGGPNFILCDHNAREDRDHLFFSCTFATKCWSTARIHWDMSLPFSQRFLRAKKVFGGPCFTEIFVCVCWNIWRGRNDFIFNGITPTFKRWKVTFQSDLLLHQHRVTESTDFTELADQEPWLSSMKLVVKPDMLFGKRGKSGLVALNLDLAQVRQFVKERLGVEVEMGGCKAPITTFIVEPFVPHDQEYYLSIVSDRLGCTISFSECGGIEIEENWDKVKTIFLPTEKTMTLDTCAPLISTLPLEVRTKIGDFIRGSFSVFQDLDFSFMEMNPFTLVNGEAYPLDMRGELDDTAAFKNFKKWGNIEFPLPFGRVMSPSESYIHELDEKTSASLKFTVLNPKGRIWTMVAGGGASVIYADTVGDLGYAAELGNYAEYSGAPKEEEVLQYARVLLDCVTADPDGRKRALLIGGGIANFTDVAATFSGIIRALREKESKLKAARVNIFVRRGGPNYLTGLAKMRALGAELGLPIEVYGPEATMTAICKQAIGYVMAEA